MHLEQLDRRRLMSVSVAETYPGYWEIHGSAADDTIVVSVNMEDGTFGIDGGSYGDGALEHVSVFGYGGNDVISVIATGEPGWITASINAGDGDDSIYLNFGGGIWGGIGNDRIEVWNAFYGEAYGGDGNDTIIVGGDTCNAEIRGGAGNDILDARQSNAANQLYGEAGDDVLYASSHGDTLYGDAGNDTLYGGAGDDEFYTGETVQGGGGYDIVYGSGGGTYYGIAEIVYT